MHLNMHMVSLLKFDASLKVVMKDFYENNFAKV